MISVRVVIFFSILLPILMYANQVDVFSDSKKSSFTPYCSSTDEELLDKVIRNQIEKIEKISSQINLAQGLDDLAILGLYNERGIALFFLGKFDGALDDFNHILRTLFSQ